MAGMRTGAETQNSAMVHAARQFINPVLVELEQKVGSAIRVVSIDETTGTGLLTSAQKVQALRDHELLALDAWTEGQDEVISAECARRAESARRFAHYLGRGELAVSGTVHLENASHA
jgi:hypothetical protein